MEPATHFSVASACRESRAVAELWATHMGGIERALDKWQHAYRDNPAGCGEYVLANDAHLSQLVGAIGLHARRIWRGAKATELRVLADFVVDPRQRTLGPALGLMRAAAQHAHAEGQGLLGWPNTRSQAVARRAGLQTPLAMQRYAKLLRSGYLLNRLLRSGAANPARLTGWLQGPLDVLAAALDGLKRPWATEAAAGRWEDLDDAHPGLRPALETIWSQRPQDLCLGDRSAASLLWRFSRGGWQWALWNASVPDQAPAVRGYAVWRQKGDIVEVADIFGWPFPAVVTPLLRSLGRHLRRQTTAQVMSLELTARPSIHQAVSRGGLVARGAAQPVIVQWPPGCGDDELFLTSLDRDPDA